MNSSTSISGASLDSTPLFRPTEHIYDHGMHELIIYCPRYIYFIRNCIHAHHLFFFSQSHGEKWQCIRSFHASVPQSQITIVFSLSLVSYTQELTCSLFCFGVWIAQLVECQTHNRKVASLTLNPCRRIFFSLKLTFCAYSFSLS